MTKLWWKAFNFKILVLLVFLWKTAVPAPFSPSPCHYLYLKHFFLSSLSLSVYLILKLVLSTPATARKDFSVLQGYLLCPLLPAAPSGCLTIFRQINMWYNASVTVIHSEVTWFSMARFLFHERFLSLDVNCCLLFWFPWFSYQLFSS